MKYLYRTLRLESRSKNNFETIPFREMHSPRFCHQNPGNLFPHRNRDWLIKAGETMTSTIFKTLQPRRRSKDWLRVAPPLFPERMWLVHPAAHTEARAFRSWKLCPSCFSCCLQQPRDWGIRRQLTALLKVHRFASHLATCCMHMREADKRWGRGKTLHQRYPRRF